MFGFVIFWKHLFVGVLIAYAGVTQMAFDRVAHYFPFLAREEAPQVAQKAEETDTPYGTIPTNLHTAVSRVLLEHPEFQRAAVVASKRNEPYDVAPTGPLTEHIEDSLVNIYCQYKTDTYIRTTTGTGFFIHPKGVILTNAHVAQFLLLKDTHDVVQDTSCVIRSGNPATPKYKAELLYISPTWIFENANVITEESPRGTGERDYALLYISKSIDNEPLPTRFPSIAFDTALLSRAMENASVVTAGYPAEEVFRSGADAKLPPVVASTTISTLYTFGSNYADIFSITESPVGEQGASGGPIVTPHDHEVIGLIVTKGDTATEGPHSLRALTLSYIDRTIIEETGYSLMQNMQGDVALRGSIFKRAMVPFLAGILEAELKKAE